MELRCSSEIDNINIDDVSDEEKSDFVVTKNLYENSTRAIQNVICLELIGNKICSERKLRVVRTWFHDTLTLQLLDMSSKTVKSNIERDNVRHVAISTVKMDVSRARLYMLDIEAYILLIHLSEKQKDFIQCLTIMFETLRVTYWTMRHH